MDTPVLDLTGQRLTESAWSPFGWLPVSDDNPHDGANTLTFEWQDAHVNLIHHSADEITRRGDALVCDQMFRHLSHTQTLLVLDADCIIAVAAADTNLSTAAELDHLRAFFLRPGDSLVLHQGTWHWGPFPLTTPRVDLFNVQGRRYAEDNDCRVLTGLGTVLCRPPSGTESPPSPSPS